VFLAGCPNPQGQFDDFGTRYEKTMGASSSSSTGGGGAPACSAPAVGMADGTYMLALSTKLSPKKPLAFKADITTMKGPNGLQFSMTATPLSYTDQMTPVQAPITVGPFDVAADGSFDATLGTLMITGMANPITMQDITANNVIIHGHLCTQTPNFVCGTAEGKVTAPIMFDLAGSAFTLQKEQNGTLPAPVIDCNMTPAKYM
jgi:hypothetical protein